jgi:hypothetical protein
MKNPIFPAIAFLLLAWASIAILTATMITSVKLVVKLWAYLNPPKLVPSAAAVYAPIFEQLPIAETSPSGFQIALGSLPTDEVLPTPTIRKKKVKATLSALIREEFGAA